MQNIFLLIRQKCSKISSAHLRPGGLLYYSVSQQQHISSLIKIFFVSIHLAKFQWMSIMQAYFAVFLPSSSCIPTSSFINFGDICQTPRLLHPPRLLFWPKFASFPVYSALPFYLKPNGSERALKFDLWKTLSENYKPIRVWLWLVFKFTENYCRLRLLSEFIQTQKRYCTSLDKICILTWKLLVISM